tara:strand:+ start:361 stop:921 length:561 start_codon:yes stop_codon:yes gene_type:complete
MPDAAHLADCERDSKEEMRRDFLVLATGAMLTAGTSLSFWPLIDSMNPAADTLSLAVVEIDLAPIQLGQRITVKWRNKPVFVTRRDAHAIRTAEADDDNPELIDPQRDSDRVEKSEWLIVVGICTHLGCIPLGQKLQDPRGKWGGWFCPCHGSAYDTSGRVRRGPAPKNLFVPSYRFVADTTLRIG